MTLIDRLSKLDGPCGALLSVQLANQSVFKNEEWEFFIESLKGSVDAAISLAERVLPNERPYLARIAFEGKCQWRASFVGGKSSWSPIPAIALCIAILRAKEANHAK